MYIVEIAVDVDRLSDEMNRMRVWLDHMRYQPIAFRHGSEAVTCRIDFVDAAQAEAFAQAFAGRVTGAATNS